MAQFGKRHSDHKAWRPCRIRDGAVGKEGSGRSWDQGEQKAGEHKHIARAPPKSEEEEEEDEDEEAEHAKTNS